MEPAAIMGEAVAKQCAAAGLRITPAQAAALAQFLNLLRRWNRVFNLTAILEPEVMIARHLIESLALGSLLAGPRIADVGSGAGLPGLPLAVVSPERHFTLIESRGKRVRFLRHATGELGLRNVEISHARVEDLPCASPFDTVLARAVAAPGDLLPMIEHLTRPGTIVLLLAGRDALRQRRDWGPYVAQDVGAAVTHLVHGTVLCLMRQEPPDGRHD
jgi:16S rRNA (guanine527-N7)-methyltransferase